MARIEISCKRRRQRLQRVGDREAGGGRSGGASSCTVAAAAALVSPAASGGPIPRPHGLPQLPSTRLALDRAPAPISGLDACCCGLAVTARAPPARWQAERGPPGPCFKAAAPAGQAQAAQRPAISIISLLLTGSRHRSLRCCARSP